MSRRALLNFSESQNSSQCHPLQSPSVFSIQRHRESSVSSKEEELMHLIDLKNSHGMNPGWINENGSLPAQILDQSFPYKENPFIEVTFLNKIARFYLSITQIQAPRHQQQLSQLRTGGVPEERKEDPNPLLAAFISLILKHFEIKVDFMESTHLFSLEKREVVWEDGDLELGKEYFLFFVRSGFKLTPQSLEAQDQFSANRSTVLFSRPLFHRKSKEFRIMSSTRYEEGHAQELYIIERRRNVDGFHCPVMQCGKQFRKSCDLAFHFNIESGSKPFACKFCKLEFRRPSALNHHLAQCRNQLLSQSRRDLGHFPRRSQDQISTPICQQLWRPSLFLQEEIKKSPGLSSKVGLPPAKVEEGTIDLTSDMTLMSIICSQILKNYASEREVVDLVNGPPEKLKSARLNLCMEIIATTQLLQWMKPLLK